MRVIAGEFRGRRLAPVAKDAAIRPTSDRAREALFSMLGDVGGLRVLDLFCGTGALGIEAVSRGAAAATLIDIDTDSAQANLTALGLTERVDLVRSDAMAYLGRSAETYDLITCDPPYGDAQRMASALESALPPRVSQGGRVVVESALSAPMPLDLIGFALERERRYGQTLLRIWRKER